MRFASRAASQSAKQRTSDDAAPLIEELRQALAAASNYVGVARLLFQSNAAQPGQQALSSLVQAEEQIQRAGNIARRIRDATQS